MKPSVAALTVSLALSLLFTPVSSSGQQPGRVHRIGWLINGLSPKDPTPRNCPHKTEPFWQASMEAFRERGYIQGQNLVIECRWTEGRDERAPALASELVDLKVDLIVATATNQVRAAKQATSTIPIVMVNVSNPVERGLVANLARPGGNVTGPTDTLLETQGKLLQLLKEAVPTISRVAVLTHPGVTPEPAFARDRETAARALDMTLPI